MRRLAIIAALVAGVVLADTVISNQGAKLGPVIEINCSGAGVTCTRTGSRGNITLGTDGGYGSPATACDAGVVSHLGLFVYPANTCLSIPTCSTMCSQACPSGQFATATNESGGLTCASPDGGGPCAAAGISGQFCSVGGVQVVDAGIVVQGIYFGRGKSSDARSIIISPQGAPVSDPAGGRNTGMGDHVFEKLTTGNDNVCIGADSCANVTSGGDNVSIGRSSLNAATTAGSSTCVGLFTCQNTTTGTGNTAFGVDSLLSNTTGGNNTAIGPAALWHSVSDDVNVGIGVYTLYNHNGGSANTFVGAFAASDQGQGSRNAGLGYEVNYGYSEDGGSLTANNDENVAVGFRAIWRNLGGSHNTAIGSLAGTGNTSNGVDSEITASVKSQYMTFLGALSGQAVGQAVALTYGTALGAEAKVGTSGTVVLGRYDGGDVVVIGAHSKDGTDFALQVTGGIETDYRGIQTDGGIGARAASFTIPLAEASGGIGVASLNCAAGDFTTSNGTVFSCATPIKAFTWASFCEATPCPKDPDATIVPANHFLQPLAGVAAYTPNTIACNWRTAGVNNGGGGTVGVVIAIYDVTGTAELCNVRMGACNTASGVPTSATLGGCAALTASHLYVTRIKTTSDCATIPGFIGCTVQGTQ